MTKETTMRIIVFLGALLWGASAWAQPAPSGLDGGYWAGGACNAITFTGPNGPRTVMVDANGNLCVSGTFSATLAGFAPSGNYTSPMSVTSTTSEIAIPAGSPAVILVSNVGIDPAYVNLGTTSGVTATTADVPIGPGAAVALTVGSNTYIAAITGGSDTTTLNIAGGSGLFSGIAGATGSALPTGASTSANQTAIQGTTAGGTAPTEDNVVGATYNLTLPTLTTGQSASLQSDSLGRLLITSTQTGAGAASAGSPRFTVAEDSNTVAGSASLPTGSNTIGAVTGPSAAALATAALQTTGNTALSTINTTLGSPFQAGGSIANTSFGISGNLPAFASTPTVNLGTLNGAATATNQTGGSQKTQIVDGSGNVIASTSNNLNVQCANCSGSGVSTADGASFSAGSSLFAGSGGFFQTTATSNPLTNGKQGVMQLTAYRALMTDWYNSSGTEMGTSGSPVQVSLANTGSNGTAVAVSAASLPLPSGAATAANQEVTSAGTSASSAQAVQGVTGGVALPISGTVALSTGSAAIGSLTAGSAIIGKAGIDQTTAGTTNGVAVVGVNAATALAGAGATGTGALRVTAAQDTTTIAGSAPGTAGSASANVVTVQGVASMTHLAANVTGNGGATLDAAVGAATTPTNGIMVLGLAASAEPTVATNGQSMARRLDLTGREVTSPYANKENWIRGGGSSSTTGATITVLPSGGGSLYTYLTGIQCGNSSATSLYVTLSDGQSSVFYLPAGGGSNVVFETPLVSSGTATAITATLSSSNGPVYCYGQGFKGT